MAVVAFSLLCAAVDFIVLQKGKVVLMPFPRMTTRRWMIAVAVVALALWTGITARTLYWNHARYREAAARWEDMVRMNVAVLQDAQWHWGIEQETMKRSPDLVALHGGREGQETRIRFWADEARRSERFGAYCKRMRLQYEHAARYPLPPVPPDPPPPK